jgi:hypothetical protein
MADLMNLKRSRWAGSFTKPGFRRYMAGAGLLTTGVGLLSGSIKKADQWRSNVLKGLFPGSSLPSESGRFGIRTNRTQAGVEGLRFNFRRK